MPGKMSSCSKNRYLRVARAHLEPNVVINLNVDKAQLTRQFTLLFIKKEGVARATAGMGTALYESS